MSSPDQPPRPSWAQPPNPGPGWASPGTPPPSWHQPPAPKPGMPKGAKITLGIIGGLVLIGGCNAIINGGKDINEKTAAASAKPTTSAKAAPPQAATSSSAPAASASSNQPAAPLSLPPTQLAPLEARKKAAAVLRANDAYYRDEFNNGVTVILARGNPGSFDAFHAWFEKASKDVQPSQDAFSKADANFDASNEPPSIGDWRDDNGNLMADVFQLANDGLDVGGPDDANARQKVQADIAKMNDDFAKAEQDAANVEAGK